MKIARVSLLALLLVFLFASMPATGYAAGNCGENVSWHFEDGCLTISGVGAMTDFSTAPYSITVPWRNLQDQITSVIVESGITRIGNKAFENCVNLTSVTLPDTITTIGVFAFNRCSSLESITIPYGVTKIERSAFDGCTSLSTILLPDSLQVIEMHAFVSCTALTSITIPNSVTNIHDAFIGCNLDEVHTSDILAWSQISFYSAYSNPIYHGAKLYVNGELLTHLVVPEGCMQIGTGAFAGCKSLQTVTLPEGLTVIGKEAFLECKNLEYISVPSSLQVVADRAFEFCFKLKEGNYGGSLEQLDGILVMEGNTTFLSIDWELDPVHILPILLKELVVVDLISILPTVLGLIIYFIHKRRHPF